MTIRTADPARRLWLLLALLALLLIAPLARAADAVPRIGVYDSRAVAMAYAGSSFRRQKMDDLKARHQLALQAGDQQAAARLQAEGKAWQSTLHRQGFGTAPVDDLLVHIQAELPRIQREAGVSHLASKWDLLALACHPLAERIDLTMQLVDAFAPSAGQRQHAIDIQRKAPCQHPE
jgi:hypothetical protein